jgi:hypothetical protein
MRSDNGDLAFWCPVLQDRVAADCEQVRASLAVVLHAEGAVSPAETLRVGIFCTDHGEGNGVGGGAGRGPIRDGFARLVP